MAALYKHMNSIDMTKVSMNKMNKFIDHCNMIRKLQSHILVKVYESDKRALQRSKFITKGAACKKTS